METGELGALLNNENAGFVQRVKTEGPPAKLSDGLKKEMDAFLLIATRHIPPQPKMETVYHEGTAGILPSPAKKIVAKDIMSQKPASPLKIVEEEEATEKFERPVDQLSFHIIMSVDPSTAASRTQIEATTALFEAIGDYMKLKSVSPSTAAPDILLKKQRLVLKLLRANAVGSYSFQKVEISSPADIAQAISAYEKGLKDALTFSPTDKPSSKEVAQEVLRSTANQEIFEEAENPNNVPLRVIVYPEPGDYIRKLVTTGVPFLLLDGNGPRLMVEQYNKRGNLELVPLTREREN